MPQRLYCGCYTANAVYALVANDSHYNETLVAMEYYDRSKVTLKAIAASLPDRGVQMGSSRMSTDGHFRTVYKPVAMGRDRFNVATTVSKNVGETYIIVPMEDYQLTEAGYQMVYDYLMEKFDLPLMETWTNPLLHALEDKGSVVINYHAAHTREEKAVMELNGSLMPVSSLAVINCHDLTAEVLAQTVTELIEAKTIQVSDVPSKPLQFESFDGYIEKYGPSLVKHLEGTLKPLKELDGTLTGFAAKTKRLYPQQAACVNGIIALKKADSRYGLMVEGMGCGKTVQAAATVDAYFNQKWLSAHPGKSLRDLYLSDDKPSYRNVVMAPSHLVRKWKEEIEKEIPETEATIITDFNQLVALRSEGKVRTGRRWYLIAKDFAKLGSSLSPIPAEIGKQIPKLPVCADCYADNGTISYKTGKGKGICPRCGGHHFIAMEATEYGQQSGMICPSCGNLLIKYSAHYAEPGEVDDPFLLPRDFSSHTEQNNRCYICGEPLWGVDAKPVGEYERPKKMWYKVSHYKNLNHKSRTSAFVLRGHENGYLESVKQTMETVTVSPQEYGPRRANPSQFIRKYLKGYFDFAILDEAHKYEGAGSAQANAAAALVSASGFTLGLTGTISNGKADSLFYLLYMLDPRRMRKAGYEYGDVMPFARKYGAVETIYASCEDTVSSYNSSSRGKQISSPRVKPGISPLLFTDFLLDKAVFLDLSDLSAYLPALKEQVVVCDIPDDVRESYSAAISTLKEETHKKEGRGALSAILQLGLSFPDKPYGRSPIMSPIVPDYPLAVINNCDEYREKLLPKEEKLISLVNDEIAQDRNCFVYCSYTGQAETNITNRLKDLIEAHCNLAGRVQILESASPAPIEREAWIQQKAVEGKRVFICNPKTVETGLDFCFTVDGVAYNYPTIIFYQMTYELATIWQASRRHYRLNQTEECHTYYLATDGTLQTAAVEIMAEKQVAASAIQGKFSADGLASMAKGVDPRIKLAQMMSDNDTSSRESLSTMFDALNASNASEDDKRYAGYEKAPIWSEIMGSYAETTEEPEKQLDLFSIHFETVKPAEKAAEPAVKPEPVAKPETAIAQPQLKVVAKTRSRKKEVPGQLSIFDLLSA